MVDNNAETNAATPRRKKYVTRACDACKKRKSKCDGCEPCSRCTNSDIVCAYKSSYNRVQRRQQSNGSRQIRERRHRAEGAAPVTETSATAQQQPLLESTDGENDDPGTPMRIDNDEGDASVHTFLRRVSSHLALIGQGLPRYLFKREEEVLAGLDSPQSLILPPEDVARSYLECFFEHSNVTYRYVHRGRTMDLLGRVYKEDDAVLQDHTKMAIVLLSMGLGCIWLASWRQEPLSNYKVKASRLLQVGQMRLEKAGATFPPTLGVLQAHVLKCQLELAFNRYNSAWMTLGTGVRLGQMIDIQKDQPLADAVDEFCRRGVFWALYMIDRYLAVSLGRPMAIHDSDVTIPLPSTTFSSRVGAEEAKIAEGVKGHARLTRIVGQAIARLYPGVRTNIEPRDQAVADLEAELEGWLRETPSFFHPRNDAESTSDEGFYNVKWIFHRQQRTIRSAYYFTNMLIYRGHLLMEFLHQAPSTPLSKPPSPQISKCIESALEMAKMGGEMADDSYYNAVYWTTSYFIFCAISILLVYMTLYRESDDRSLIESVVEKAMKGHRKLSHTASVTTQKLLEESRSRATHVRDTDSPSSAPNDTPASGVQDVGVQAEPPPQPEPSLNAGPHIDDAQQLPEMWSSQPNEAPTDLLEGLNYELDPLSGPNGFGMIMDIGFDNAAMPPNFSGTNGIYRF